MHPKEGEIEALHSSKRTGNIYVTLNKNKREIQTLHSTKLTGNRDVIFIRAKGKWVIFSKAHGK